jgi:hypothetical protein
MHSNALRHDPEATTGSRNSLEQGGRRGRRGIPLGTTISTAVLRVLGVLL